MALLPVASKMTIIVSKTRIHSSAGRSSKSANETYLGVASLVREAGIDAAVGKQALAILDVAGKGLRVPHAARLRAACLGGTEVHCTGVDVAGAVLGECALRCNGEEERGTDECGESGHVGCLNRSVSGA